MRFAFYQGGKACDVEHNLRVLEEQVKQAAASGTKFIVFPELYICGYTIHEKLGELAEHKYGNSFKRVQKAAKEHQMYIAYGYSEKHTKTGKVYNSVMIIDSSGNKLLNYRKIHLYSEYEKQYFSNSEIVPPIITIEGINVAVLICYDIEFPEPARILALHGAQFIIVPTANTTVFVSEITVRSRAFENHVFVAYVNRVGQEGHLKFCGTSTCVGPNGDVLAKASGEAEELCFADIDLAAVVYATKLKDNPFLDDRLPHLYEKIIAPIKK